MLSMTSFSVNDSKTQEPGRVAAVERNSKAYCAVRASPLIPCLRWQTQQHSFQFRPSRMTRHARLPPCLASRRHLFFHCHTATAPRQRSAGATHRSAAGCHSTGAASTSFHHPWLVVLPDHMHCVLELPAKDADFALRWRLIKTGFAKRVPAREWCSEVRQRRGERGL